MDSVFSSVEVIGAIVGTVLAFALGLLASFVTQVFSERRQKAELTYSKKVEEPLILTKNEFQGKMSVMYQNVELNSPLYIKVTLSNTGKKLIRKQAFTCLLPKGSVLVDPLSFPVISTIPVREVGPISLDPNSSVTEPRYIIEKLGITQTVVLEFLITRNNLNNFGNQKNTNGASQDFEVILSPNEEQEVSFIKGQGVNLPSFEKDLQNVVTGLLAFFVVKELFSFITLPLFGTPLTITSIGTLVALPFLIPVFRSVRPLITTLSRLIQEREEKKTIDFMQQVNISGGEVGNIIGSQKNFLDPAQQNNTNPN